MLRAFLPLFFAAFVPLVLAPVRRCDAGSGRHSDSGRNTGAGRTRGEAGAAADQQGLAKYETPYYIMHTDIDLDDAREAALRMTKMAEEYHARTSGFSGEIKTKLPFFLYRRAEDYYAQNAPEGSAGVFDGQKLMAVFGEHADARTWHVIQHEGFHQFAQAVIRGDLPIWVNEGLAEYFGEGLFTGDGFVTGLVPPWRMQRVKDSIKQSRFRSIKNIMRLSHGEWNNRLAIENYDQAWSMVHFLAHGDDGRYQKAFSGYMKAVGGGVGAGNAWQQNFGDAEGFEKRWQKYWSDLPDNPTSQLYTQATAATLTSFLARATAQKQTFPTMEAFLSDARAGSIQTPKDDWLPPALLAGAVEQAEKGGAAWSLEAGDKKQPCVVAVTPEKTRLVGIFILKGSKVAKVSVTVDDLAASIEQARTLIADGKKPQARSLLQSALRAHPDSPDADAARKLVVETK